MVDAGADDGADVPVAKAGVVPNPAKVVCGAGEDVPELVPVMLIPSRKW